MNRRKNSGVHKLKTFGNQVLTQTSSALAATAEIGIPGICVWRKIVVQSPYNVGQKKPTVRRKKHFRRARDETVYRCEIRPLAMSTSAPVQSRRRLAGSSGMRNFLCP